MDPPAGGETMNPPAGEKEEKKKKKYGFWRKKKKKYFFSNEEMLEAFSRVRIYDNTKYDSAAMTPMEEVKMLVWCATDKVPEGEKNISLCTAIRHFMFCLPRSQHGFFGEGLDSKLAGDVLAIDLRGQDAYTAMKSMGTCLLDSSLNPAYMKVRVGCTKHGVRKGKLKQAVIVVFKYDASIIVDYKEDNGTVISIKLDSTLDYRCLGPFWLTYLESSGPFGLLVHI